MRIKRAHRNLYECPNCFVSKPIYFLRMFVTFLRNCDRFVGISRIILKNVSAISGLYTFMSLK